MEKDGELGRWRGWGPAIFAHDTIISLAGAAEDERKKDGRGDGRREGKVKRMNMWSGDRHNRESRAQNMERLGEHGDDVDQGASRTRKRVCVGLIGEATYPIRGS